MSQQTLSMNFNGLRTTSPAWESEVIGFPGKSSKNCQERCGFLSFFRSGGLAVARCGTGGKYQIITPLSIELLMEWHGKFSPPRVAIGSNNRSSKSQEVWLWARFATYTLCGRQQVVVSLGSVHLSGKKGLLLKSSHSRKPTHQESDREVVLLWEILTNDTQ